MHVADTPPGQGVRPGSKELGCSVRSEQAGRPGDEEIGWLAQSGRVPSATWGSEERPVPPLADGVRCAVGDPGQHLADSGVELLVPTQSHRSGSEKIFPCEKVEGASTALRCTTAWSSICPSEQWSGGGGRGELPVEEFSPAVISRPTACTSPFLFPSAVIVEDQIVLVLPANSMPVGRDLATGSQ